MSDVTRILSQIETGDTYASEQLLPLVYDELRKLAAARLASERSAQTLQATALVYEAYLRLVNGEARQWDSRGHFFAAAAEAMRRILIDRARRKQRPKHGGGRVRVNLDSVFPASDAAPDTLLAMDDALTKLAEESPQKAELIRLRYYTGCSLAEAGFVHKCRGRQRVVRPLCRHFRCKRLAAAVAIDAHKSKGKRIKPLLVLL